MYFKMHKELVVIELVEKLSELLSHKNHD